MAFDLVTATEVLRRALLRGEHDIDEGDAEFIMDMAEIDELTDAQVNHLCEIYENHLEWEGDTK